MVVSFERINTNGTCLPALLWNQTAIDSRRPQLYVCIIATVTHSIFWLQFIFYPTIRQKTMQWLYAYLLTDILLLARFFFTFIVRTTSYDCTPDFLWLRFVCYFEAAFDNYLNILEVYILLALNLCRYGQITRNQNVYRTYAKLLAFTHALIYFLPLISLIIQIIVGWAQLNLYVGESCDIGYANVYAQMLNTFIAFIVPIVLNVLVICASVYHIQKTAHLHRAQHHVSAREKYHRSLFTSGTSTVTVIASLLNYIEIALDPFIIGALDVRFCRVWKKIWRNLKDRHHRIFHTEARRIVPMTVANTIQALQQNRPTFT